MDDATLDALTRGLYAAGAGERPWTDVLADIRRAFGARAAIVQQVDLATGRVARLTWGGYPMQASYLDYLRHWHAVDPRRGHIIAHAPQVLGRVWQCGEQFDDAFAAQDPFYRHFLPAHDTRHLACRLHASEPATLSALALELPASRGPLDGGEAEALTRLGTHFEEALRQESRLLRIAAQALAGHRLLDGLDHPLWLVDSDRAVLHANAAALASPAHSRAGRWHWPEGLLDRRVGDALHGLLAQPHGARRRVDLRRRRADSPCWLLLQTLRPGQALGAFGDRPVVLMLLLDPARLPALEALPLAESFGLTPAQARVAVLLAAGQDAGEIAATLGCALSTVRSHLRKVLQRLGARRSIDAVRLLRQTEALWAQVGRLPDASA